MAKVPWTDPFTGETEYTEATGNSSPAEKALYKIMRGKKTEVTAEEWAAYRKEYGPNWGKNDMYKTYETTPFD